MAEQREAHSDGADLGGEDFGYVDVHCGVAQGSSTMLARRTTQKCREINVPLECEVEKDEEHSSGVSSLIGGTPVLRDTSNEP